MATNHDTSTATVETVEDYGKNPEAITKRWLAEVKAYDKTFGTWRKRATKVVHRYRDENVDQEGDAPDFITNRLKNFNIFWSNVQTLQPALFSQSPKVVVKRRNKDRDPIALTAAEILKRSLEYMMDYCDYEVKFKQARDDYLITGRGQLWVRYEPVFGAEENEDLSVNFDGLSEQFLLEDGNPVGENDISNILTGDDGVSVLPDAGESFTPVLEEKVHLDYILWSDFGHTSAPTWDLVTAVWKRTELTRDQLIDRFGEEVGKEVTLTKQTVGIEDVTVAAFGDVFKRGVVYEIWDKEARKVYWVSPGYNKGPLDVRNDPLGLRGFFPCPRPMYATTTTDSLIPVPDYIEYQAQALSLDVLTQRIDKLTIALRVVGAYDGSFPQLEQILRGTENQLIPIDNWAMFAEKGGIVGSVSFLPIKEIAEVLVNLVNVRNQIKQDLYEITGLSDLVRGQSSPSATATAERIKGKFVSLRMQDRQREMNRFVRDCLALVGEIMAEHFSSKSLLEISSWLSTPNAKAHGESAPIVADQAIKLLRDDRLRTFRIDIETETTLIEDIEQEKNTRVEFLQGMAAFLQQALPAAQQFPKIQPLLGEMLMYGVRAFHKGADLEEVFERTIDEMAQQPTQPDQQAGEAEAAKQEMELKGQEIQAKSQAENNSLQLKQQDLELKRAKQQFDQQIEMQKFQAEEAQRARDHEVVMQELRFKSTELDLRVQELNQNRATSDEKFSIDRDKMEESKIARIEDRTNQVSDTEGQRDFDMQLRRMDGLSTPTLEETVLENNESTSEVIQALENIATLLNELVKQQSDTESKILTVMSAPRKLVRNAKTNRIEGAELDLSESKKVLN